MSDTESRYLLPRITLFVVFTALFFSLLIYALECISYGYQVTRIESPKTLDELIRDDSKEFLIPENLVRAIIRVESTDGLYLNAFESRVYESIPAKKYMSDFERRAMASSHGIMQVMGFNASRCGIKWHELYDVEKGLHCGISLLADCLKRHKSEPTETQITNALGCYNGDIEVYPNKVRIALANIVLKKAS